MFDPTGVIGLMPHVAPGRYLHEMVATGTGTTLRWFRTAFGYGMSDQQLITGTSAIPRGSEGLLCFPDVEGATVPFHDDAARGIYYGIGGHHRRTHFHPRHPGRHRLPVPRAARYRPRPWPPHQGHDHLRRGSPQPTPEPDQGRHPRRGHHPLAASRRPPLSARRSWPAWARACSAPSKMASPSPSKRPRPCTPTPMRLPLAPACASTGNPYGPPSSHPLPPTRP